MTELRDDLAAPPVDGGVQEAIQTVDRAHGTPSPQDHDLLREGAHLMPRVEHPPMDDYLPAMPCHVIAFSYPVGKHTLWRSDGKRIEGRSGPGNICVTPKGNDGKWTYSETNESSFVFITSERLQSCADQLAGGQRIELIPRVYFQDASSALILELLGREAMNKEPSAKLFVDQAIDFLCVQLVRGHSSFGAIAAPAARRGLADWQVKRVTSYMREHIDEEIGLDELAATVNLSRFHFCTAFRMATGHTPYEWLVVQRIDRAKQLLSVAELRITDVALAVGYATPSAFAASFRKVAGITPTEFRRAR